MTRPQKDTGTEAWCQLKVKGLQFYVVPRSCLKQGKEKKIKEWGAF